MEFQQQDNAQDVQGFIPVRLSICDGAPGLMGWRWAGEAQEADLERGLPLLGG